PDASDHCIHALQSGDLPSPGRDGLLRGQYVVFFADRVDSDLEKQVFQSAYAYVMSNPEAAVYYYSKYERTH
ncbi:MAG: hypothetical protein ACHBMF_04340, partial [Chromatiales bacterium]